MVTDMNQYPEALNLDLENCTVLCGSFNPIHDGHEKLIEAAHKISGKDRMVFELTVNNVDKGSIDEE